MSSCQCHHVVKMSPHDPHYKSWKRSSLSETLAILPSCVRCPDRLVHIINLVHIVHPHDHPVPHVLFKDSLEEIKLEANNISEIAPGTFFGLNHLRWEENIIMRSTLTLTWTMMMKRGWIQYIVYDGDVLIFIGCCAGPEKLIWVPFIIMIMMRRLWWWYDDEEENVDD